VFNPFRAKNEVHPILKRHFGPVPLDKIVSSGRTFPVTCRVDLQTALEGIFPARYPAELVGVFAQFSHETLTFAHVAGAGQFPIQIGPLLYDEVDIGETVPARCLKSAMWLAHSSQEPFAVLVTPGEKYGREFGIQVQIAVSPGETGLTLSRSVFEELEKRVNQTGSYRGKVISLEATQGYSGKSGTIKVHKLRPVARHEVILPEKTLHLLERNIHGFIQHRPRLRDLGITAKKGLLFYGPPGTGKTHTIHYLASQLRDHTTLLITSEQVGLLDEYFQLARFLQPAMVVIEDVDLIARAREEMRGACEESLLNKLLNEMDGLREDADVLFILTTNRPDQLEAALASRPGRIDQAVEFPLPDEEGRRKLTALYSRGLVLSTEVAEAIVRKTNKASPAFIKELMRRSAQYNLESSANGPLKMESVEAALEEILFSGGSLNIKLLGGAGEA
jgi:AAA+ superfamily predicted ATPase